MRSAMAAVALGAALACVSCGESKPMVTGVTNAASAPAPAPTPIKAAPPVEADPGLVVTGPIIVEHQVDVTAQRDGVLQKILVDAPARVKVGTVLAQLDDRQITANLEAARAKSRSIADDLNNWKAEAGVLEADYVRAQHLWDLGLISQEQLQHAQYKAESDQWDIKRVQETLNTSHEEERSLELELAKTKIVAPFNGVIARRYVREGQEVNKGERLFWVTEEAPLLMRFTLPEKYFGHVSAGQVFAVTTPDVPGEQHAARVKEISPVVDPSSGTFEVLVELTGKPGSLRPGMTANLKIKSSQ
ncbi:MAG TPA: efflux RND transporter periplasmic adaptor subunit [Candidatus Sulfotelmatobacter sp.]|nr:efflux RND transporter periplasmic adaptor subunit [Candidatus Sulfotelmatobacter sp.]